MSLESKASKRLLDPESMKRTDDGILYMNKVYRKHHITVEPLGHSIRVIDRFLIVLCLHHYIPNQSRLSPCSPNTNISIGPILSFCLFQFSLKEDKDPKKIVFYYYCILHFIFYIAKFEQIKKRMIATT